MNTNFLAPYIWKNEEWLEMALHVYKAMPAVREHLIEAIFKAVGKRVEELPNVTAGYNKDGDGVYFWNEKTGDFGVFAELNPGQKGALRLIAGLYVDDAKSIEAQREEVRERFNTKVDLKTWSDGKSFSQGEYVAYAYVHQKHGGHWHDDGFLSRAILSRDEVVSNVAEILVRIYKGMWPR